jgi:hypothetical protein
MKIEKISVIIEAKSHNPTILNPDFLKRHGMIDPDLEVREAPICSEPFARVAFENGITITAQFDQISFSEEMESKSPELAEAPGIALAYVRLLEHVNYLAVRNSFNGVIRVPEPQAESFVMDRLIQSGAWKQLHEKPGRAMVRFVYPVEKGFFSLSVGSGSTEVTPEQEDWYVFFRGDFERPVTEEQPQKRLEESLNLIHRWIGDLQTFSHFVEDAFLNTGGKQ